MSDSPKLLPNPIKFTLSYPDTSILPTNATAFISFGDGKRHIWKVPESQDEWSGEYEVEHVYEKSGTANVDVEIANVVSKIKKKFQVDVSKKIVGIRVGSKYNVSNRQLSVVTLPDRQLVPINTKANFTITIANGDVEYYLVNMNDELYKNTTDPNLSLDFDEVFE